jgi:hypothetical protein
MQPRILPKGAVEVAEKSGFGAQEIKAGLALHVFLQFGRNSLQQRQTRVNWKKMEADVGFADDGGVRAPVRRVRWKVRHKW